MRTRVSKTAIKNREKYLHTTVYVECNYLALPLLLFAETQILILYKIHNMNFRKTNASS